MISIIIPTLNEEKNLDETLQVLSARGGELVREIIVADGGSSDKTLSIAKQHGCRICRCTQKGRARQMNEGAALASGKILYFLHADTHPPNHYDKYITESYKNDYLAGCFTLQFDSNHPLLKLYGWFTKLETSYVRFGDQSLYINNDLFKKINGFRNNLIVMEDQEIIHRIKKKTPFNVMKMSVTTSAQKYRDTGVVKLQFIYTVIFSLFYLGVNQKTLVHIYKSLIYNS